MRKRALAAAFPYTVPVLAGYVFLGMAFGVLMVGEGFDASWPILMSVVVFAGSMQFIAVDLLNSTFNLVGLILLTISVNARHLFYGISMIEKFGEMGRKKLYMMFALTDETYSILSGIDAPAEVNKNRFNFLIASLNHAYWVIGTAIGALVGAVIPFNTAGIEFAMTALFVVIFVEQWKGTKNHLPAIGGVVLSLASLLIFGADHLVIISMVAILAFLLLFRKRVEVGFDDDGTVSN